MLKRYHLMKLQREERQSAAAIKRMMLEKQKKYKLLANRPVSETMLNSVKNIFVLKSTTYKIVFYSKDF